MSSPSRRPATLILAAILLLISSLSRRIEVTPICQLHVSWLLPILRDEEQWRKARPVMLTPTLSPPFEVTKDENRCLRQTLSRFRSLFISPVSIFWVRLVDIDSFRCPILNIITGILVESRLCKVVDLFNFCVK
ncbi:hypothetical protein Dimus_030419 [Dionaea muscipula]